MKSFRARCLSEFSVALPKEALSTPYRGADIPSYIKDLIHSVEWPEIDEETLALIEAHAEHLTDTYRKYLLPAIMCLERQLEDFESVLLSSSLASLESACLNTGLYPRKNAMRFWSGFGHGQIELIVQWVTSAMQEHPHRFKFSHDVIPEIRAVLISNEETHL